MIEQVINLFDEDYLFDILNEIKNMDLENQGRGQNLKSHNYYNRYHLNIEKDRKEKIEEYLFNRYDKTYLLKKRGFWVNEVTVETNKEDIFHIDLCDLTIVTYLNENFSGGEFEYINELPENVKIKPNFGLSLVMNDKLYHRVLPVTNGVRYSLICGFDIVNKTTKTLI
jgi:predicted 2-oxoglutarate/Fe(II)-dependent dioxygenase YbiX